MKDLLVLLFLGALIVAAVAYASRAGYRAGCRDTEARWQYLMQVIDWADSQRKANL